MPGLRSWRRRSTSTMPAPRKYPDELRERAIREVRATGRPIAHVAKDLGIHKEALRGWVHQAVADRGERDDRLTTAELDELKQLRSENAELRRANEILKAASVFLPRRSTVPGRGRAGERPPAPEGSRGRSRLPGAPAVAVDVLRTQEAAEVRPTASRRDAHAADRRGPRRVGRHLRRPPDHAGPRAQGRRGGPLHRRAADGRARPGRRHPWPAAPDHGSGAVGAASAGPGRPRLHRLAARPAVGRGHDLCPHLVGVGVCGVRPGRVLADDRRLAGREPHADRTPAGRSGDGAVAASDQEGL
jgi:transposase